MDEPIDHHYVPVFYLSRWVGADGCICRFSQPHGKEVKPKRVVPKGTGFEPRLYETRGFPPERAQTMEKDFMAKLDAMAADALKLLEDGLPEREWTSRLRSSWSCFIHTQTLRTPEDIAQLKASVAQEWSNSTADLRATYAATRSESDPPTFDEFLERQNPGQADAFALDVVQTLMDHSEICQFINNMHWKVLDASKVQYLLLTSDRPIWMTPSLTENNAMIIMPIGPRKLFTAVVNPATQQILENKSRNELVKFANKLTVQHAVKYVYGLDDSMLPFIQKHIATKRHSTSAERLAAKHGHEILATDSPAARK